ncbi:HAD family hydrolase [Mesobacillus foraminis]|uniref:HAD superfamily hydrolase (TIGR01509 family)/HAD superfamily hydrolase (TIGR01549 family) n=1 Tax=Mesobacillus foraminis TaxID=279826 RepID=A0A4R2BJJ2_9BACI|nr:HAD-IA family hydrolase [Mesobacillus foraminis]TCN26144.1 HAD superfamily hydrolase (TIGR01509 family)/HAD superfamily hydrolase (TIGR01549 family) [Mesobacillus foraminis]
MLLSFIHPLPTSIEIRNWSEYANIHILSNHRVEWVEPILQPIQGYLKSITISSEAGCCKPQPEIYAKVKMELKSKNILYVDDQEKNFNEARILGWNTLLADEKGAWIDEVYHYLAST